MAVGSKLGETNFQTRDIRRGAGEKEANISFFLFLLYKTHIYKISCLHRSH